MKKIILIGGFILSIFQLVEAQKLFTISGQVVSVITEKPFSEKMRVRINNKTDSINSKGAFKIKGLESGKHVLYIENESYARDTFYGVYDTIVLIQNVSLNDVKIIVPCPYCDCEIRGVDKASALDDIRRGLPNFFFIGGVSGMDFSDPKFWRFSSEYGVQFEDLGCVSPDYLCIEIYTNIVFDYLDKKYGKKWRKDAPKEALGL